MRWYELEKVLDEEIKSLNTLVKWLKKAVSSLSELYFLQVVRDGLADVKRLYKEVELIGLEHGLVVVNASLNQISTVLKSVHV